MKLRRGSEQNDSQGLYNMPSGDTEWFKDMGGHIRGVESLLDQAPEPQ